MSIASRPGSRRPLNPFLEGIAAFLLVSSSAMQAGEFRMGIGVFALAPSGKDLLLSYRPTGSAWTFGLRHASWVDVMKDPFTERPLSETTEGRSGVLITRLFRPNSRGSMYLGAAVFRWSKTEKSLQNGDSDSQARTVPYAGVGYTRTLGRWGFWNTGIYLCPGPKLKTQTSTGSEEDSGSFDIQAQVGIRF